MPVSLRDLPRNKNGRIRYILVDLRRDDRRGDGRFGVDSVWTVIDRYYRWGAHIRLAMWSDGQWVEVFLREHFKTFEDFTQMLDGTLVLTSPGDHRRVDLFIQQPRFRTFKESSNVRSIR